MSTIYCLGCTDSEVPSMRSNLSSQNMREPRKIKWKPATNVTQIVCASKYTLFLTSDGKVYSYTVNIDCSLMAPKLISDLEKYKIIQIASGMHHSHALTEWGQLYSWGINNFGQLGIDGASGAVKSPMLVKTLAAETVIQIACGNNHSMMLTSCGKLYSCGANLYGQLGIAPPSTMPSSSWPKCIEALAGIPIAYITCGSNHSFALTTSGAVYGWGCNFNGQLGVNDKTNRCFPQELETLRRLGVRYIACGDKFSVFLTDSGGVLTCGCGAYGQLGHGTNDNEHMPRMVIELMGTPISQIACGWHHTLALAATSGRLYGFGLDCYGQFGQRKNKNTAIPDFVNGPWLPIPHANNLTKNGNVLIRQIFSGGFRSFVTTNCTDVLPAKNYRMLSPRTQILQLTRQLANHCISVGRTKPLDMELLYTVELVFHSQACWNASFSEKKQQVRLFPEPGIDIQEAIETFKLFNSIENAMIKNVIWDKVVYELIPSLSATPTDVEPLRVYLLLPLYGGFQKPEDFEELHAAFGNKVLCLDSSSRSIIWQWWAETPIEWFEMIVRNYKRVVEHLIVMQASQDQPGKCLIVYDESLETNLDLLQFLYDINRNGREKTLSYEIFYIERLSEYIDVQGNFMNWMYKKSEMNLNNTICEIFNISKYTFLFNASAKTILLETDQGLQMAAAMEIASNANIIARFIYGEPIPEFITIEVTRENLVIDALREILAYTPKELKKPLRVKFKGEEAEDAGGVRKEFFMLLLREILDPKFGMFREHEETHCIWFAESTFETEDMYFLIGVICGLAIYNYTIINLPFPLALYKKLLNVAVNLNDLLGLSPVLARSLQALLDYEGDDVEEAFGLNFEIAHDVFGKITMTPLKPNGNLFAVTASNKQEYVNLYVDYVLNVSVERQFEAFKKGFAKVCWGCILRVFEPEELMALVVGNEKYDWKTLEENCDYRNGYSKDHATIKMFWEVFHELPENLKKKFLLYLTGCDRIPIQGMNEIPIRIQPTNDERFLPVAHTCFNLLDLPRYKTKEVLKSKLLQAIEHPHGFSLV